MRTILYFLLLLVVLGSNQPVGEIAEKHDGGSTQSGELCLCEFAAPKYPPLARLQNVQGIVRLRVTLDANGYFSQSDVLAAGHPLLEDSPIEAVKTWRSCESSTASGSRSVDVTFKFVLDGKPTDKWAPTLISFQTSATVIVQTSPQLGLRTEH
jgi:TonB family protein